MKSSRSSSTDLRKQLKVQLPRDYPWKVLGLVTDDLAILLTEEEQARIYGIIRKRDFEAYQSLTESWSPQSMIQGDTSLQSFAAKYQVASLLKKFQFPTDSKSRRHAAMEKFMAAEHACSTFNHKGSRQLACLEAEDELAVFTYARTFCSKVLGEFLPELPQLTQWSRHGPGANLDTMKGQTSLYAKYKNWPYSCTLGALGRARSAIEDDERWLGALQDSYRRRENIPFNMPLDLERFWSTVINVVPGNRITFVPKNAQTDRSIAIEPSMNLYLQLGVDGFIRRRLKRWGVNLDCQEKNKELARIGSLYHRSLDPYVTLDLSAASDTISTELCRLLLPVEWYDYLMDLRSPSGTCDEETLYYHKISSMGNGFTFALESLIFASVVYGCMRETQGTYQRNDMAVFGDDIIVRQSLYPLVVRMLNLFGFTLNPDKSFSSGPFRESCGADWFDGRPVRPVFLDSTPTMVMGLWCDINRIRRVQSLRGWGFESSSIQKLEAYIPTLLRQCVGPLSNEEFDSYMHSPTPTSRYRDGMWKFTRLNISFKQVSGNEFLFRKLMHPLRPQVTNPFSQLRWGGVKLAGKGSRFDILNLRNVNVKLKPRRTSIWSEEYVDCLPMKCTECNRCVLGR